MAEKLENGWWLICVENGQIVHKGSGDGLGLINKHVSINFNRDTQWLLRVLQEHCEALNEAVGLNRPIIDNRSNERLEVPLWLRVV